MFAFTAGCPTSSRNRTIFSTLLTIERWNGSSSMRDLQAQPRRVLAQLAHAVPPPSSIASRGGITSCCQMYSPSTSSRFLRLQLVGEIQIRLRALHVEAAHRRIEIGDAERAADRGDHRQARLAQVRLISFRSRTSISSGSAKISMVSKPISLVSRIPSAVPTGEPSQAELISPEFHACPPLTMSAGCAPAGARRASGSTPRPAPSCRDCPGAPIAGLAVLGHDRSIVHPWFPESVGKPDFRPLRRDPDAGLAVGRELDRAGHRVRIVRASRWCPAPGLRSLPRAT